MAIVPKSCTSGDRQSDERDTAWPNQSGGCRPERILRQHKASPTVGEDSPAGAGRRNHAPDKTHPQGEWEEGSTAGRDNIASAVEPLPRLGG